MKNGYKLFVFIVTAALILQGCGFLPAEPTQPPPAATLPATPVPPTPEATAVVSPQCVVQKRVDFRNGPGTAYDPPLQDFEVGTVLTPNGFNPNGIPDGAWVQVTYAQSNVTGWVGAGPEFLKCNIDLSTLPQVAVAPPAPTAPQVSNKPPDGPSDSDIQFEIVMDPNYLMEIRARIEGEANNGDGIDRVTWIIERNGEEVYTESEGNAAFCIFKGGEPDCNRWPMTDGRPTWGEDGAVIENGDYKATIRITRDSDDSNYEQWTFEFSVNLP